MSISIPACLIILMTRMDSQLAVLFNLMLDAVLVIIKFHVRFDSTEFNFHINDVHFEPFSRINIACMKVETNHYVHFNKSFSLYRIPIILS